ncbi:MAG: acetolactate synthase large subunit [Gammaproteobacteria bacterium]|nr:acetolactate synthase large subunit [Gammaproteobacteria bacterium]
MNAAELFIKCLENEGVTDIFGIPGEENLDVMDALLSSKIRFITTRHEQGAAFMADVFGRLTGKAGVCLATLGPGATNLVTGVADANMDRAPIVAIAGQASTHRMHKESHQVLDLVNLFEPISKYSTQLRAAEIIPEVVRKAFKVSEAEKPGCAFIDFPENIAEMEIAGKSPLKVQSPMPPAPPEEKIRYAAEVISNARFPIIMIGNGVIRAKASSNVVSMAEKLGIPAATTFMAKGAMPSSHELSLGTVGLQAHDYVSCGFDRADVVICIGYDMVEYHPLSWNPNNTHKIIHIDSMAAEVDENYIVETGVIGNIGVACDQIATIARPHNNPDSIQSLHNTIVNEFKQHAEDNAFPVKPQKIIWDLKQALNDEDIVISDVGAHKMWMARMYQAEKPNTCIISNGFASMGIAVPGAIAAKVAHPDKTAVAVTGDAGFMMNSQEISTALMYDMPIVILVWNDGNYGLIKWKQMAKFGRESNIKIQNPDLVKYAESFGAKGYRVDKTEDLLPILKQAIADKTVVIIDCPVDYDENMKLTEKLGELICPI